MITRPDLQKFFDDTRALRARGKARFDVDDVCRWSYFFVDEDRARFASIVDALEAGGFEIVGTLDPEPDAENRNTFLRVDRVERHDVDSLHALVLAFYETAREHGIEFDGMDVGAVDGP